MIERRGSNAALPTTRVVLARTRMAIAESREVLSIARRLSAESTARVTTSLEHLVESEIRVARR